MSLKDKAAKINFDNLDDDVDIGKAEVPSPLSTGKRARSGVEAITQTIGIHHRVKDLEATVAQYEQSGQVVLLDPKLIRQSKWKNRHEKSYTTKDYLVLKEEIEAAGKNVQPIKVRRVAAEGQGPDLYELVYGRRRHRACLELGLSVASIVQQLSDVEAFQEMERENRHRLDLSAWEQGMMYKDAIDQGLYASMRQMAAALGIDPSNLSKAIKLASLPLELIDAFRSPLDLQFRWSTELSEALDKDAARVLSTAETLRALPEKLSSKEVFSRLIGAPSAAERVAPVKQFVSKGRVVGSWLRDEKGSGTLKLKGGSLSPAKEAKLMDFLDKLLG